MEIMADEKVWIVVNVGFLLDFQKKILNELKLVKVRKCISNLTLKK